jgi:hypothetical protein
VTIGVSAAAVRAAAAGGAATVAAAADGATVLDAPAATQPAAVPDVHTARPAVTARPPSTAPGAAATVAASTLPAATVASGSPPVAGAVALEPTRLIDPAGGETVGAPRTLSGKTATHVGAAPATDRAAPAAAVRASPSARAELPPVARAAQGRRIGVPLLAIAGAAVVVVSAYLAVSRSRVVPERPPAASPQAVAQSPAARAVPPPPEAAPAATLAAPTAVPSTVPLATPSSSAPPATNPPSPDVSEVLAQLGRSMVAKDHRAAIERAQAVLAREPRNPAARRALDAARASLRESDAAAREIDAALAKGDADRASVALQRLAAVDPRRPDVPSLSLRVNAALRSGADEARRALEQAKRQPSPATAAGSTLAAAVSPPPSAPPATLPAPPVAPATPAPATPAPGAAPGPMTPAQLDAARKSIRGVLEEYRAAVETRNADYLRRLHPSLDYEAMKASFANVSALDVKIELKDVSVAGDTASADCLVTYTPIPRPAGRIKPVPTLFKMKRAGSVWIIEDVVRR